MEKTTVKPDPGFKLALEGPVSRSRSYAAIREHGWTWLYHILRLALAAVFIYAGGVKLLDPRAFAHAIAQYDLVPEVLLPLVAIGLPALELLAGLGLALEIRGSLTVIVILLFVFMGALGHALWHNLDIDCGCFTPAELTARDGLKLALGRDLLMLAATPFLGRWRRRRPPPSLWFDKLINHFKGETSS
jgi:uncharacterized membrane protein YphA (DoxX/SURF4 family)